LRKTGKCWGERNTHRHWVVARRSADDVAQDLIQRIVLALGRDRHPPHSRESDMMMSETQIHSIARQMLEQIGPGAIARASEKAQACDSHGEADEAKEWRHIADAMKMMRGPHQS
jgi:hypothetical protein